MLGAIAGDMIGSVPEWAGTKTPDFESWAADATPTDDTVLTLAVAREGAGRAAIRAAVEAAYPAGSGVRPR